MPPPQAAQQPPAPAQQAAPFSKSYLEQEFPGFYSHHPPAEQAERPINPVLQLQGFLNTQGDDGWCLLGIYNVGPMLLMTFRRRRAVTAEPSEPAPGLSQPIAADPNLLHQILDRLNRLEQGHQSGATSSTTPEQVQIISVQRLKALPADRRVTTAEAARQLGFRSTSGMSAFLRRNNYQPGLVKRGHSKVVAVYEGSGNRQQHVWRLVDANDIDRA